jgi:GNAT superfamily N-acetyltransferase
LGFLNRSYSISLVEQIFNPIGKLAEIYYTGNEGSGAQVFAKASGADKWAANRKAFDGKHLAFRADKGRMAMLIRRETEKEKFMDLLLLADEQESMVRQYLDRGEMHAMYDDGELRAVCVVTDEGGGVFELANIAVRTGSQRKGYGKKLVQHILGEYAGRGTLMMVGTGDSPITVPFYQSCGFKLHHRIKNYILNHYDHPIYERGVQLIDKVYLAKSLD